MATEHPVRATVLSFDREVGLGRLRTVVGDELPFHAVAITDGSRDIAVDVSVLCERRCGHAGVVEAHPVTPLPGT